MFARWYYCNNIMIYENYEMIMNNQYSYDSDLCTLLQVYNHYYKIIARLLVLL